MVKIKISRDPVLPMILPNPTITDNAHFTAPAISTCVFLSFIDGMSDNDNLIG